MEDAASQLDFLYEISATTSRPAELLLLKVALTRQQLAGGLIKTSGRPGPNTIDNILNYNIFKNLSRKLQTF